MVMSRFSRVMVMSRFSGAVAAVTGAGHCHFFVLSSEAVTKHAYVYPGSARSRPGAATHVTSLQAYLRLELLTLIAKQR